VAELELRLSQAVVQTPPQWELAPLAAAANHLLVGTTDPPVRAQLREVLERIAQFQQIQQRYLQPGAPVAQDPFDSLSASSSASPSGPPAESLTDGMTGQSADIRDRIQQDLSGAVNVASAPSHTSNSGASQVVVNQPLYDAAGLLKPVVSKRESAPQYALVGARGEVVSFVTPTPDLNLTPYVGRQIGVHGTRGYMPEYRKAHVTAGRVTPIESAVRR
jgi:hypothetical protein